MQAARPADVDRLPWLEPYRDSRPAVAGARRGGKGWLLAGGGALLLAVGAGGYWLGQTRGTPAKIEPSATVALAPARPVETQPAPIAPVAPPAAELPAAEPASAEPVKTAKPKTVRKASQRRSPPRRKIRSAGVERSHIDAVRAAQREAAPTPTPVTRSWPRMPSPGPAGQVIQLGAFSTAARASNAYSRRVARYPLLARMPRVIVPVVSRPDGRVLYVLRLGTSSRQQSKTVCRNLRASGDHCLVIG